MLEPHDMAHAVRRLVAAGCTAAEEEAAEFVAAAPDRATLDDWLRRREEGEPPAWIVGGVDFCGLRLRIEPGVYVPRPQTEELARRAGALLPPEGWALDLCAGAGGISAFLQATSPRSTVLASERDPLAARCALLNGVRTVVGDLAAPVRSVARFDVVTAVAPYVPTDELRFLPADVQRYEPRSALDGGADGLEVVRRVVADAARVLRDGGWLLLEIGGEQDTALVPELRSTGFGEVTTWWDEEGDLRGVAARRCGAGHAMIGVPMPVALS
jgi:release factor glutamine methyltransferase